jgi:hypothetical protein
MKTVNQSIVSLAALLAAALFINNAQADSFTLGSLVVVRVGDGTTTLASSGGPLSVLEISTAGSLVQSAITVPSGSSGLQISGTATSEGQLVLNADGQSFTIAGYVPPYGGSGSLSGRSAANAPRGFVTIGYTGVVSPTTTLPSAPYSVQNIRSGFNSGSGAWFAGSGTGSGSGLVYDNGATSSTIQGVNSRVLDYYNGNLYFSTGSGTQGIYQYTGTPTSATSASAFLTGITGQGTSPYDFVFSPDGNSLYVADDAIGVQKFTFNGSVWTLAYNFTDSASANKAYGLAVDFAQPNPVLYWTSPTDLWSATDLGVAAAGASVASAGANYAFRGLEIVPEPSTFALTGIGLALLLKFRRAPRKI